MSPAFCFKWHHLLRRTLEHSEHRGTEKPSHTDDDLIRWRLFAYGIAVVQTQISL